LIRPPADALEFETRWSQDFVRLAESMPGLRRVAVSRVTGGLTEKVELHMVHEFFFDNARAVREAMASPEGQAAGRALMAFGGEYITLCFAEHLEEDIAQRVKNSED
jgi:uncharacterized protein (TIGR02118 family)